MGLWSADEEEDAVYTPPVTLWAFLSQMVHKAEQRSCVAAVARVVVLLAALGHKPPSGNTGAYCRARAKLPEPVIRRLTLRMAKGCEEAVPSSWLWHGRHVKLVDGTTASMPDTKANQAEYPQHSVQDEGVGFPIMRMVLLFSLATGMLCDMAMGPYQGKETGEPALFRELFGRLEADDIVLGDRCYCSYFMIALLKELGVDFVVRLHQARTADFRRGRRLGHWGSFGQMDSAGPACMDGPGDVRPDAGVDRASRGSRACEPAGLSRRVAGGGHHACAMRKNTRPKRLPRSTAVAGWRSWIFARSRSPWTWTCCGARRRKWCAAKCGRTCWRTI